ncbi:ABC transporter ATP-binding protein [Solwaraspora sp. WMMD792]|uniref:ABC transporter ATP-binding protein n=1 Tax=Solwaraspora sp. WMMD792 TaxID=3016099 RepID=UPI002417C251|nr:ABC transporter ATP-binding protein [Solwaraspora sp. WMMD792]MDG4773991.1 ABC transporter ATP-binding protein [Solwaraspora sp. WMMD792]
MSGSPVIVATDLSRRVDLPGRRSLSILRRVNLTVGAGETVAVVGRSGSGKTTLLAMLGLLTPVNAGQLTVVGADARKLRDQHRTRLRNRHIGFVFQSYSLVRHLSAYRNVELPLRYGARIGWPERRRRTLAALDLVGLADRARSKPRHLSGGEQQRVAIARALVRQPSIILADEPTGALDVETAARVLEVLTDAARQRNCALVVVTHDEQVARRMSRTVRLVTGELIEE